MFIGAEGTLGVITSVSLLATRRLQSEQVMFLAVPSFSSAVKGLEKLSLLCVLKCTLSVHIKVLQYTLNPNTEKYFLSSDFFFVLSLSVISCKSRIG